MDSVTTILIWLFFCVIFLVIGAWLAIHCWSAARHILDTPSSRIRSAAQGYVELHGQLEKIGDADEISPLTRTPCVWWRYRIEKRVNKKEGTEWHLVEGRSCQEWLRLNDGTGTCLINPAGAEIEAQKTVWEGYHRYPTDQPKGAMGKLFSSKFRYTEECLQADQMLYVIGEFMTRRIDQSDFDQQKAQAEVIAQWQEDQQAFLKRFDVNGDGELDEQEWQRIHDEANAAAMQRLRERATQLPVDMICKPEDSRPFAISSEGKRAVVRSNYIGTAIGVFVFSLGITGLTILLLIA